jgi:hypothetical protein
MKTVPRLPKARVLACVMALAASSLLFAPGSSQARTAPWTAVPSPNATSGNNVLAGVSSVSAGDVWAVGQAEDANGNGQALIEHWNGTAWSVVPNPTILESNLRGVAAVSAADVWAVGSSLTRASGQQALIEHWNGVRWTRVKSPVTGPGTVLNAVTVVSRTNIWAVGEFLAGGATAQTLTEHWDGSAWSVVPSPDAGTQNNLLIGVAAVSSTDVWAVGDFLNASNVFQTLTENWNGSSWTIVPSPSQPGTEAGLNAVATASDGRYIWAVGESGSHPLIEQWNGTSWVVVHSPTRAGTGANILSGIAIVNGSEAWAVGQSQDVNTGASSTLIEQWNGVSWSIVASPNPAAASALTGATADPASGQVWAVGFDSAAFSAQQTLTEFKP